MNFCVLAAVLCIGTIQLAHGRAQFQPNPTTTYPGQVSYPGFPGGQGGFPGGQGGFPGIQGGFSGGQGGFPGIFGGGQSAQNQQVIEEYKRRCLANGGPKAFEELEFAGSNIQKCVAGVMPTLQSAHNQALGDVCKTVHSTLRKCLVEFTVKFEKCLEKSLSYAPGFQIEVFDSIFKFVCKDNAKHIMTFIMAMAQPSECMQKLQVAAQGCLSKTKKFKMEDITSKSIGNITKPELCSDTKILRDCVIDNARKQCTGDMLEFITGVTNAIHEPCSACKLFITNSVLLFVLVLFTKLF